MSFDPRAKSPTLIIQVGDDPVDALVAGYWIGAIHESVGVLGTYVRVRARGSADEVAPAFSAWANEVSRTGSGILGLVGSHLLDGLESSVQSMSDQNLRIQILRRPPHLVDPFPPGKPWSGFFKALQFDPTESGVRYDLAVGGKLGWVYIPGPKSTGSDFIPGMERWDWPDSLTAWKDDFTLKRTTTKSPGPAKALRMDHPHGIMEEVSDFTPVANGAKVFVASPAEGTVVIFKSANQRPRYFAEPGAVESGYIAPTTLSFKRDDNAIFTKGTWWRFPKT